MDAALRVRGEAGLRLELGLESIMEKRPARSGSQRLISVSLTHSTILTASDAWGNRSDACPGELLKAMSPHRVPDTGLVQKSPLHLRGYTCAKSPGDA
jgi:hypothetical protein